MHFKNPQQTSSSSPFHPSIFITVTIVFAILVDLSLSSFLSAKYRLEQETETTLKLGQICGRIEEQINSNMFLIYGMGAYISIRDTIAKEEFENIANSLLRQSTILKNIAAAPDFIISYIYPLKGNEKALGLNYRNVPSQWNLAKAAQENKKMILAGPIKLVQGGTGLAARVPVFLDKDDSFWGLVSAVIDFDSLLANIPDIQKNVLNLAFRGKDGTGAEGEVFFGDSLLFSQSEQSITMPVALPSGEWLIAAKPIEGWVKYSLLNYMLHSAIALFALIICVLIIKRYKGLLSIHEYQGRLKAMSQASRDPIIIIDSNDIINFWNPAAELMFGWSQQEAIGKHLHEIIVPPKERAMAQKGLVPFAKTGKGPIIGSIRQIDAVMKSGLTFKGELSVTSFYHNGMWYAAGTVRDITARLEYERKLEILATTDPLTGLANRRRFWELANMEIKRSIRYKSNFSILMIDIDHFKAINDTYGHATGDIVLKKVSRTIKNHFRETDFIGRIGGEEFAVLLPQTPIEASLDVTERLRKKIEALSISTNEGPITATISIGLASCSSAEQTLESIMSEADKLLYNAKNSGRNMVCSQTAES